MTSNSSPWNAGRFLKTLAYFEVIPFVRCLQRLFQGSTTHSTQTAMIASPANTILVVGATGGVGKRVVQRLMERGYPVRAMVRDLQRGRSLLGEAVPLIDADLTLPETLTPAVVENIRAVICCTGARVQPIEGDTPDRAKYYQGIKFYQPEVVGDTPEAVDYQGIQHLLAAVATSLKAQPENEKVLFDFTTPQVQLESVWGALDDVVMGGVSESTIRAGEGAAVFTGTVSTANSGGFTSVRTRNLTPTLDLTGYTGIKLRLKGDGNRYKFLLRSDDKWDSVAYAYSFDTEADRWLDVYVPFSELIPVFRAKTLPTADPIDARRICSLQLMLSKFEYDGALNPRFTAGAFTLQVASIAAYGGPQLPKFVLVSSAGVTRPGRPGLNLEEEPPAVGMNEQLGGILTWKLRGEEAVRTSGLPYTIIRPCALTEEPGGHHLRVEQGDTLRGKVSRDDVAELCLQALEQPNAYNVTFEVSAEDTLGSVDWTALFSQLQPDRPGTP